MVGDITPGTIRDGMADITVIGTIPGIPAGTVHGIILHGITVGMIPGTILRGLIITDGVLPIIMADIMADITPMANIIQAHAALQAVIITADAHQDMLHPEEHPV